MKPKYYTKAGHHPDDVITRAKTFVNELQAVQEQYFNGLLDELNLKDESLHNWIFDYVYNEDSDTKLTFTEHLKNLGKDYNNFVREDLQQHLNLS
jgi:hypothetical protein